MRRAILTVVILAAAFGAAALWFTRPMAVPEADMAGKTGDPVHGETVFRAAGCASCHTAPGAEPSDAPVLAGGRTFASPFGTFAAPNISPDKSAGIGGWSDGEIVSAVMRGVSREGAHLYPAFPYTSYSRAGMQDIVDLVAYLRTLPADPTPNVPHDVGFPFNQRWALGFWKLLFARGGWVTDLAEGDENGRGRYLVEALGHCGECHTPRNALGGLDTDRWLGGAPNPSGSGTIPNITPGGLDWSEGDIAEYLSSGFTPEFDSAGGAMAEVIENTSRMSDADRAAIAAYLKAVPAVR